MEQIEIAYEVVKQSKALNEYNLPATKLVIDEGIAFKLKDKKNVREVEQDFFNKETKLWNRNRLDIEKKQFSYIVRPLGYTKQNSDSEE